MGARIRVSEVTIRSISNVKEPGSGLYVLEAKTIDFARNTLTIAKLCEAGAPDQTANLEALHSRR